MTALPICKSFRKLALAACLLMLPTVAAADAPEGIEEMLKTAIAREDKRAFDMLVATALDTWPGNRVDILKLAGDLRREWMPAAFIKEVAEADAAAAEAERQSRARGFIYFVDPELWNAAAQVGAATSTGDTDEQSFTVGLSFNRAFGERWEHDLKVDFDFARSRGDTTRRRLLTRYETLFKPWDEFYLLNYVEADFNKFSGYDYRLLDSIAIGAQLLKSDRQSLRLEGGPGVRFNKFEDTGLTSTEFLGRVSSTYDLKLTENLDFQDRVSVIFGTDSITIDNRAILAAQINSSLAARLSFQVQYDSDTPIDAAAWDTITRATLVYDF